MELEHIRATVNGNVVEREVEPRMLLADFLRDELSLLGTHLGCEHGICGACTVMLDGAAVRSCLLFAVQANGHEVTTVEDLASPAGELHPLQEAFRDCHALQCGFCTPGFLMSILAYDASDGPLQDDDEIRHMLGGNLCRCTGYHNIVEAVRSYYERSGARTAP